MRFLLDQGLPRSTVPHLKGHGIEAEHVGDLGMSTASDSEILQAARDRNAVVATLDSDFHALLALSRASSPSTVRIRIEGLNGDQLADLLARVAQQAGEELLAGAALSVEHGRIRIHFLPIGE